MVRCPLGTPGRPGPGTGTVPGGVFGLSFFLKNENGSDEEEGELAYSHSLTAPTYFGYLLYNVTTADICIYMCVLLIHMWLSTVYVVIVRVSREFHIYVCAAPSTVPLLDSLALSGITPLNFR